MTYSSAHLATGIVAVAMTLLLATPAGAEPYATLDAVPVVASPRCAGTVSAEAQVTPVQTGDQVEDGVRIVIHYDAGVYDGSCTLTDAVTWTNLDTGATGGGDVSAVSVIDGHYGFIGYGNTQFKTGRGTVVFKLASHPGTELRVVTT